MRSWVLPVACLVLVGLAAAWFLLSFERTTETEPSRPRGEAQRDPLLAARRMLESLELPVRQLDALQVQLNLAPRAALILPAPRGAMSPALRNRLDAFVRGGGHLILESELLPLRDPLLDHFGVTRVDMDDDDSGFSWSRGSWSWREPTRSGPADEAYLFQFDDQAPKLALHLRGPHALIGDDEALWQVGESGTVAQQMGWGQGRVTVFNSLTAFQNWDLGRYDHAEFLHWLMRDAGAEEVVFIRPWRGGLLTWIGDHFWKAQLPGAILLVLLLWAIIPRFGPIQPDPELARRRLLDHLAASGRLLWSRGERRSLAQAARQSALRRLRAEYPHTVSLSGDALTLFLARRCGLDSHQAGLIAGEKLPDQPLAFLVLVRACRRVHLALAKASGRPSSDPLYEP